MDLRIPQSGDAVTEVQLVEWSVKNGEAVKEGDVLYSIESEKAVIEVTSPGAGQIEILAEAGSFVPVGELVGRLA
jgi:pyruvate/2-oxoglutarate dehydrogenase complex dihydrolipoamide acyltransferase (E2) component